MSSGTSTPRTASATPIPPPSAGGSGGENPAPLTIGTRFVKQYYHEISTSPELIVRFYQPATSIVTVGSGSDPATEVTDLSEEAAARFHVDNGEPVRFEFGHGAIDAQQSVNGGVLLVVTGQMISSQTSRSFVHTFFLGLTTTANKKSYFVHNDILRFLHQEENGEAAAAAAAVVPPAVVEAGEDEIDELVAVTEKEDTNGAPLPLVVDEHVVNHIEDTMSAVQVAPIEDDAIDTAIHSTAFVKSSEALNEPALKVVSAAAAPGRGVEESKEAVLADDDDTPAPTTASTTGPTSKPNSSPQPPGSWASLVARKTTTATPPTTPGRHEKVGGSGTTNSNSATTSNDASNATTTTAAVTTTGAASSAAAAVAAAPQQGAAAASTPVKAAASEQSTPAAAAAAASTTAAAPAGPTTTATAPTTTAPTDTNNSKPYIQRQNKRDPDCTLVIKNIDLNVTDDEILGLFTPFTTDTTAKVVGCTVQAHRGIAFVDYDSPEPVLKAVSQQSDVPFTIRERKLEIYQKTVEQRSRGGGGGGRSGGYRGGGGRDYRHNDDGGGRGGRFFRRGDGGGRGRDGGRGRESGRGREGGGRGGMGALSGGR